MSCVEVNQKTKIKKVNFVYKTIGPTMEHNYLCAVCKDKSAVQNLSTGVLQPCIRCQKKYRIVSITWIEKLFGRGK